MKLVHHVNNVEKIQVNCDYLFIKNVTSKINLCPCFVMHHILLSAGEERDDCFTSICILAVIWLYYVCLYSVSPLRGALG